MTIFKSIKVDSSPEQSFSTFCDQVGQWWPRAKGHSIGSDRTVNMIIEGHVGGRFYEIQDDGSEYVIGRVTEYSPPSIVAFTWRMPTWDVVTQVRILFTPEGEGTRVELEHSGWEQGAVHQDMRKRHEGGWDEVLEHYVSRTKSMREPVGLDRVRNN